MAGARQASIKRRIKGQSYASRRARAGGIAVRNKYGRAYFAHPLGHRGGTATLRQHHRSFFAEIGAKGGKISKRPKDSEAKHPHAKRNLPRE